MRNPLLPGLWCVRAAAAVVIALLNYPTWALAEEAPRQVATDIERGRYLAQIGNCASCHTAQNGASFAGGREFQTPYAFLGNLYSSNITPDPDTGLGQWTQADFVKAMRTGVAPGGKHLFPAFPYPSFTKLADSDLDALYAYLKTLPAMRSTPPANSFWFRQRWAMWLWNALFLDEGQLADAPKQPQLWNRGRYLVEGLGHCGACHTPRNVALAERRDVALTGGAEVDEVGPGKLRRWSAPDLTPTEGGLGRWSAPEVAKYLKTGSNRHTGTFGPMNEVIANSLRYLTDVDASAIAAYLKGVPATGPGVEQHLSDAQHQTALGLYEKHCEDCHLQNGRGAFRKAPPLVGSVIVQAQDPASLLNVLLYGARSTQELPPAFDAWEDMPGFADKMTDADIVQLANFVRSEWGNRGGIVRLGAIRAQR